MEGSEVLGIKKEPLCGDGRQRCFGVYKPLAQDNWSPHLFSRACLRMRASAAKRPSSLLGWLGSSSGPSLIILRTPRSDTITPKAAELTGKAPDPRDAARAPAAAAPDGVRPPTSSRTLLSRALQNGTQTPLCASALPLFYRKPLLATHVLPEQLCDHRGPSVIDSSQKPLCHAGKSSLEACPCVAPLSDLPLLRSSGLNTQPGMRPLLSPLPLRQLRAC